MLDLSTRPRTTEPAKHSSVSHDLLAAAEGDAAEIVARARVEIARALLKARHDLVVLTSQLDAGLDLAHERDGETSPGQQAAADARRDLLQTLHEARPDLGALAAAVRVIAGKPQALGISAAALRWRIDKRSIVGALIAAGAVMTLGFWVGLGTPAGVEPISEAVATQAAGLVGGPADADALRGTSSTPTAASNTSAEPTADSAADGGASPRAEIMRAGERWLEAYYAKDRTMLAVLSAPTIAINDDRTPGERLPPGLRRVTRTLGEPSVQVFGSEALLTAKMIERAPGDTRPPVESFISQMWSRRAGVWRLTEARIVSAGALQRAFRR